MTDRTPLQNLAAAYAAAPAQRDGSAPPIIESEPALNSVAAMWTPEAQARHKYLTNLPDSAQAHARTEIGYLESAKAAAAQKEGK